MTQRHRPSGPANASAADTIRALNGHQLAARLLFIRDGTSSGTNAITLSLSFPSGSPNMTFKVRGFKANYQPSEVVSQNFSASSPGASGPGR